MITFLLGTGPSLNTFDWSSIPDDAHICAVNGAGMRSPRMDSMVFADPSRRLLVEYGEDRMRELMTSPGVVRVAPGNRKDVIPKWVVGMVFVDRNGGQTPDRECKQKGRHAFDGQLPLFWTDGLSCSFALCWLVYKGHRDIVFVGHDMLPGNTARHFYADDGGQRLSVALERQFRTITELWPLSLQHGITLRAAAPSRLLEFMPLWEASHAPRQSAAS